jgi:hypothetical protein
VVAATDSGDEAFLIGQKAVCDIPRIPAVGEGRTDGVFAFVDELGDIIGLRVNPPLIGGPTGGEPLVRDALAIQFKCIDSECAGVERVARTMAGASKSLRKYFAGVRVSCPLSESSAKFWMFSRVTNE